MARSSWRSYVAASDGDWWYSHWPGEHAASEGCRFGVRVSRLLGVACIVLAIVLLELSAMALKVANTGYTWSDGIQEIAVVDGILIVFVGLVATGIVLFDKGGETDG